MKKNLVKVIIPIYTTSLNAQESASLRQTAAQLSQYPIVVLKPEGVDVSQITNDFPQLDVMEVSDHWLGKRNGIQGYNKMMLSEEFYELFSDVEFILICHTDAWIFRDELELWCQRGYDCIAAPWVRRSRYDLPIIKQYLSLRNYFSKLTGKMTRQRLYGRVGNGGLSLRRVESFKQACIDDRSTIEQFNSSTHHLSNEDVFWATIPQGFIYPSQDEALKFAFDTNPKYCYKLCGEQLPFGCHSWTKPKMYKFWKKFIAH